MPRVVGCRLYAKEQRKPAHLTSYSHCECHDGSDHHKPFICSPVAIVMCGYEARCVCCCPHDVFPSMGCKGATRLRLEWRVFNEVG